MARHFYKEIDGEIVYRVIDGLNPKGWTKKPNLDNRPDGYEVRPEGNRSQRRQPEQERSR